METIADFLRRRLKGATAARWQAIADELGEGLTFHSLRKIAYGERENLGLKAAQALIDYFQAVDRGEREMPEPKNEKAGA